MKQHTKLRQGLYFCCFVALTGCSGANPDGGEVTGGGGGLGKGGAVGTTSGAGGLALSTSGSSGSSLGTTGGTPSAGSGNTPGGSATVGGAGGGAAGEGERGGSTNTGGALGIGGKNTAGGAGGAAGSAGTGGSSAFCKEPPTVFALPSDFPRPPATKAVMACGVYVVGSSAVADAALIRAQQILQVELLKLCTDIPSAPSKFTASQSRLVVLGKNEDQSLYWPEDSGRRSWCAWPDANGMIEATTLEEELTSGQRYLLMTTVHEMGHFTQFGLYLWNKPLYDRSVDAFKNCTKAYYNDYDLQNPEEFFAGDTLRWFDLNPSDLAVPNASSLTQREQLQQYSPAMYQVMSETFFPTPIP